MRIRDAQVGETYLIEVPHRLPAQLYPDAAGPPTG
ncbi:hypothetical protein JJ691_25030 [Kutzneria sp. CA-103260]|nr:hypothetical protein JJ691_25030 [Kutzneria sp. CA-103260]